MAENKENNSTSKDGCGEVESQDKKDRILEVASPW